MPIRTKHIGLALALIIVVGGIVLFAVRTGKESVPEFDTPTETSSSVTLTHTFKKGTSTFTGTLKVPTPCHMVSATAEVLASSTVRIEVSAPEDNGPCLERETVKTFSVSLTAAKDVSAEVYVNGTRATVSP